MDAFLTLPALLVVCFLGASIGSFLNVVIYRVPAGLSVLYPPSRCPKCLHRLKPQDNIPVIGWLRLNGRCAYCQTPISARYPLVEAATGLLFLLVFLQFGLSWQTVGCWLLFSWLLALALIDLDTFTLPHPLTKSGLAVGLGVQVLFGFAGTTGLLSSTPIADPTAAIHALMTGVVGAVLGLWLLDSISFLGSAILGQTAMGAGDSKLAAMMGAWLGWKLLLLAGFLACAAGAFVGGGAMAIGLIRRRQPIPFGPFLALGAALAALWGEQMITTYVQLFFPLN